MLQRVSSGSGMVLSVAGVSKTYGAGADAQVAVAGVSSDPRNS